MKVRVYIIAAASDRPLDPTFKHLPGGRVNAALEVMDLDDFARLDGDEVYALAGDLEQTLGSRRLAGGL